MRVKEHPCPRCGDWHTEPYQLCGSCQEDEKATEEEVERYNYAMDDFNFEIRNGR